MYALEDKLALAALFNLIMKDQISSSILRGRCGSVSEHPVSNLLNYLTQPFFPDVNKNHAHYTRDYEVPTSYPKRRKESERLSKPSRK